MRWRPYWDGRNRPIVDIRVFLQGEEALQESVVEFWASSEIYGPADQASEAVRRVIEPLLNHQLRNSRFAAVELLLRYIPVIMPTEMLDRYPSRSKARIKQRVLDCSPQLHYETFVSGEFGDQVDAYVGGIRTTSSLLTKFGVSPVEIEEFEHLLAAVATTAKSMKV